MLHSNQLRLVAVAGTNLRSALCVRTSTIYITPNAVDSMILRPYLRMVGAGMFAVDSSSIKSNSAESRSTQVPQVISSAIASKWATSITSCLSYNLTVDTIR